MATQTLRIGDIRLRWSKWIPWNSLIGEPKTGIVIPPRKTSGVYEVRLVDSAECLTIGKASDLHRRVIRGLVLGKLPHSAGKRIRACEDTSRVIVRWAETDSPSAAEEKLHQLHVKRFGRLPKYTLVT
jgi:hypothetical protein